MLHCKKPFIWIIIAALILIVILCGCVLKDQKSQEDELYRSGPVHWTYAPAVSATWHVAFYVDFDIEDYSYVEASCDCGDLWDLGSLQGDQKRAKSMRFSSGTPLTWTPLTLEGGDPCDQATVDFSVYKDEQLLHSGRLVLELLPGDEEILLFHYDAYILSQDHLSFLSEESNMGARVALN
jgi:hypothetical protein